MENLYENLKPIEWGLFLLQYAVFEIVIAPHYGIDSYIYSIPYISFGATLMIVQVIFYGFFCSFWAEGNLLLMTI